MSFVPFVSDAREVWKLYGEASGKLAFDIGANGGMVTELLVDHFDRVIAIEPASESLEKLRHVADINPNVTILPIAVSDHDDGVVLRETTLTTQFGELFTEVATSLEWGTDTGTRRVPSMTLDQVAEQYGQPDFIKIDTEGHESHVLRGGKDTLRAAATVIVEIHAAEYGAEWQEFFVGTGRDFTEHRPYRPISIHYDNHFWITSGVS